MAMMPSAIERQRRNATRKSCTGSGAKSTLARSHSSSTRSIQKAKPILLTDFVFSDFWVVGFRRRTGPRQKEKEILLARTCRKLFSPPRGINSSATGPGSPS